MMLSELLPAQSIPQDLSVSGLCDDSRKVTPGDLFCAYAGERQDGKSYIAAALKGGAVAVLADAEVGDVPVPVVTYPGLRADLGRIASRFFAEPSIAMSVIAVTGTNGKTSFTQLFAQALESQDQACGVIGTMGYGRPDSLQDAGLTTPAPIELQWRLSELLRRGCTAVALEASSHGLVQGRLAGTCVHTAVLTNVTHDHLDYHRSFADYVAAKKELFQVKGLQNAIINADDPSANIFIEGLEDEVSLLTYGLKANSADIFAEAMEFTPTGLNLTCRTPVGPVAAKVKLLGAFNAENLLAVIAALVSMQWSAEQIESALQSIKPVAGRMELVTRARTPILIIDYAHTPDALEKSLQAVRQHFGNRRLTCIFGCGGDRDTAKRPIMGAIAAKYAEAVVLTSDNPRTEDPDAILAGILAGVPDGTDVLLQPDRSRAITQTVLQADHNDVILIAGKGHEDYQELATGRISFSDRDVAMAALEKTTDDNHEKET